jgi:hypothetical protein
MANAMSIRRKCASSRGLGRILLHLVDEERHSGRAGFHFGGAAGERGVSKKREMYTTGTRFYAIG